MELGAASAAASGKLRTHFTGAECAKLVPVGVADCEKGGRICEKSCFFLVVATVLCPPRSRGAIGRPRAASGWPSMAAGGVDGSEGRVCKSPSGGSGFNALVTASTHYGALTEGRVG